MDHTLVRVVSEANLDLAQAEKPSHSAYLRNRKFYTAVVPIPRKLLQAIILERVDTGSVIHNDGCGSYDGLVDVGYEKHFRMHHGKSKFVRGRCHINGIEAFWSSAKVLLHRLRGIQK